MNPLPFLVSFFEISIIATMLYYLSSLFWNTRAQDLMFGILAFLGMYAASKWLHLPVIQHMMFYFVNYAVIGLMILFQPELRLALSKLSLKGKRYREVTEFDKFLKAISGSVFRLADKRIGALIVLENHYLLDEFANQATLLNAQFTPELLESIFMTTTPLHDGGVIIRGTTIISAKTIFPLADDSTQLSKSMGTRHRAGLGISQLSDALVIVVSEESGKVSLFREGIISRGVKQDRFEGVIRSIFTPPEGAITTGLNFFETFKKWIS